jgi:amino acid transporter
MDAADQPPTSRKILGRFHGIGININNTVGCGIVTAPGIILKAIKSPRIVLLLWLIGGIVSMAGSLTYAELGAMHEVSGGEAKYLHTAFPKPKFMMSYIFSFMYIL